MAFTLRHLEGPMDTDDYRNPTDLFYLAKFDSQGNVYPGWSYAEWVNWWWSEVKPFGTKDCNTTNRLEMNDDFRIRITERNVARGCQSVADLEDLKANGIVTKPDSYRHQRQMCLDAARDYSALVDAGKRSKKEL